MAQPLVQPKLNYNTDSNESIPEFSRMISKLKP
jgi:hypothetical protein